MTKLIVRYAQLVWNLTGWKELEAFMLKSIECDEEMGVLIRKLVQQRDDAFDISFHRNRSERQSVGVPGITELHTEQHGKERYDMYNESTTQYAKRIEKGTKDYTA